MICIQSIPSCPEYHGQFTQNISLTLPHSWNCLYSRRVVHKEIFLVTLMITLKKICCGDIQF